VFDFLTFTFLAMYRIGKISSTVCVFMATCDGISWN